MIENRSAIKWFIEQMDGMRMKIECTTKRESMIGLAAHNWMCREHLSFFMKMLHMAIPVRRRWSSIRSRSRIW